MNTYRMTTAYDGTRYRGWQRQKNTVQTIQWIIEQCLQEILGYRVNISGSGRTDSGVHAFAQEASMVLREKIDVSAVQREMNEKLPQDIRILDLKEAENGFHARKSAVAKCYEYYVDLREKPDVFTRRYCFGFQGMLDIPAMKAAAWYLQGTHDFSSFTDLKDSDDTVRTIQEIAVKKAGDKLILTFYGDGFLYHMVRILTGTLLNVGCGKIGAAQIPAILSAKDRAWSGFPAPAKGLFLKQVYYTQEKLERELEEVRRQKKAVIKMEERIN